MPLFPAYSSDEASHNLKDLSTGSEVSSGGGCLAEENRATEKFIDPIRKSDDRRFESDTTSSSSDSEEDSVRCRDNRAPKRSCSPDDYPSKRRHESISNAVEDLHVSLDNLAFVDVDPAPSSTIIRPIKVKKKSKKKVMKEFRRGRYFYKNKSCAVIGDEDSEALKKTEEFNVALRDNPYDAKMWLEFVRFQDSLIGNSKLGADKKISIMEKALQSNPDSAELTHHLFSIMDTYSTCSAIESEAKKWLARDRRNTAAWKWLIRSKLFSMTEFSVPGVLEAYSTALEALFKAFPSDSGPLLDLLLECCLFLRQAGLWEQLWTLVQLSLELNLSTPGSNAFAVSSDIDQDKIRKTEDDVIVSGLPLGSLWTRLEYLRSCVYFLPSESDEEDPQRVVFPADVANLLHPVHPGYTSRLISVLLTALKVPILPSNHNSMKFVGIDKIPWAIESPEFLLAALSHPHFIDQKDRSCLKICRELIVSPQCLLCDAPGSREFFCSVDSLFDSIVSSCSDNQLRDVLAVWRLRWYRFVGNRSEHAMKLLQAFPKNIALYTEYALTAYSNDEIGTCFKVLERCLKHAATTPLLHIGKRSDKNQLAHLYRTYIELLVKTDSQQNRNKILRLLVKLSTGENLKEDTVSSTNVLQMKKRFDSVSKELSRDIGSDDRFECDASLEHLLLAPFEVSWFAIHAWFLYVVESPLVAKDYLNRICSELPKPPDSDSTVLRSIIVEGCYEALVTLLHTGFRTHLPDLYPVMKQVLPEATRLFPNNLFFLHIAASVDMVAVRQWSVSKSLPDSGSSIFTKLFDVFVILEKMSNSASEDEKVSACKKLSELVKRVIAEGEEEWRRCPLLWRLVLQSVAAQHPGQIKSAFYRAADLCPWVKSIYYDAAKMLPEEMGHIQDLLVEKELRIHITSEELEVLRQETDATPSLK